MTYREDMQFSIQREQWVMDTPKYTCLPEHAVTPVALNLTTRVTKQLKPWLSRVWQWCERVLAPTAEPRVWQKVDRQGRTICWQVFDPVSGQTIPFGSELEVRLWLEQRFY